MSTPDENILQNEAVRFGLVWRAGGPSVLKREKRDAGRRDIYKSEFWKGGKMTFITCQAINLWKAEGIVKLFRHESQK